MQLNPSDFAVGTSSRLESLNWVLEEVRKSVGIASGALAYAFQEKSQPSLAPALSGALASHSNLKTAHSEMKRAAGALKMVEQEVSSRIFSDIAVLLDRCAHSPELITDGLLKSVKSICFAVNSYLSGLCAGRVWSPTVLATVAQTAAGLGGRLTFHPAQLWVDHGKSILHPIHWGELALPLEKSTAMPPEEALLGLLKGDLTAAYELAQACRVVGQGSKEPVNQTIAFSGALFLLGLAKGLVPHDLYAKRTASKLVQWLNLSKGLEVGAMGLLHEIKYLLSRLDLQATLSVLPALEHLAKSGFIVDDARLGLKVAEFRVIDPELLEVAQHQLNGAKADWSRLSGGELDVISSAQKHFLALHQAMLKLWPELAVVTTSMNQCVQGLHKQSPTPSAGLSLEVATALLFLEDALGDLYASGNTLKDRAQALFERLERVRAGSAAQDLQDWMEALFRRSGEKQTMGNVAGELRHLSAEIERLFEAVFKAGQASERSALVQKLQGLLTQMKGVLGVVGLEQGVLAVTHLRSKTDTLDLDLRNTDQPEAIIGSIGSNMASLGLMVDMLSYQPSLANRLFRFENTSGVLQLLTGQDADAVPIASSHPPPALQPVQTTPPPVVVESSQVGDELKSVFAQEAHEVVEEGLDSVSALALDAKDVNTLISLRRGFHTLKGSARMVGMGELGEAAFVMEQLLNEQLTDESKPVSANLCALAKDALGVIGRWSDLLGQGHDPGWTAQPFRLAAQSLREQGRYTPLEMPEPVSTQKPPVVQPLAAVAPVVPADQTLRDWTFDVTSTAPVKELPVTPALDTPPRALAPSEPAAEPPEAQEDGSLDLAYASAESEQYKHIGPLKIKFNLYNVYLQEADEVSRALETTLGEWLLERQQVPLPAVAIQYAHTLAGNSATVGFDSLADLCRALEMACAAIHARNDRAPTLAPALTAAVEAVRYLLHQFAAGFLKHADPALFHDLHTLLTPGEDLAVTVTHSDGPATDAYSVAPTLAKELPANSEVMQEIPPSQPTLETGLPDEEEASPLPVRYEDHSILQAEPVRAREPDGANGNWSIDFGPHGSDQEIRNLFTEEANDLIPQIGHHLHQWIQEPQLQDDKAQALRALHTLKGSARLAGAMEIGNAVHEMETQLETLDPSDRFAVGQLFQYFETIERSIEGKADTQSDAPVAEGRQGPQMSQAPVLPSPASVSSSASDFETVQSSESLAIEQLEEPQESVPVAVVPASGGHHDPGETPAPRQVLRLMPEWTPLAPSDSGLAKRQDAAERSDANLSMRQAPVRVNARLLETAMNRAGEVIGSRARVKLEVDHLRQSLSDLNGNVERLRHQLREIEIQAETQMQSRLALHKSADSHFDPLEFDRFTRVQELTRMMAESVSDVATVQRNLQRSLDHADDSLVAQGRQSRELQRELLRTRMMPFDTLAQRLNRTALLAEHDTGKKLRLELLGGKLELDRQQLDRIGPSLEHLIRNAAAHGIESPETRQQAGKDATGVIQVSVAQDRNDVVVEIQDDGQGLDLEQIRQKAVAAGLIRQDTQMDDQLAFELVCMTGFTTAPTVSELAGRGIGMDVVKSSVHAAGGRMEAVSRRGQGLLVRLVLPLTTATTQVLLVRHGQTVSAIPVNMVEQVLRFTQKELPQAYNDASVLFSGETIPFYWAGALLGTSARSEQLKFRSQPVVVVRSAGRRVAMHVDETIGQQEVIVKSVGGQLASLPGLTGVSILPSGAIVLIYNPVALALVYGDGSARFSADRASAVSLGSAPALDGSEPASDQNRVAPAKKLALVVDDSITVRRVTQRLLERAGYRVALATDGLQALEQLRGELANDLPFIVLADIEMPRMDGFELVRSLKGDSRLAGIPVVMITSRLAEKHRELALSLGVNHYLGKPFVEDQFLALVAHYSASASATEGMEAAC